MLAALANAVLPLVACGAIAWEALGRFASPPPVRGMTMIVVAGIGIAINVGAALLLNAGTEDLNVRGAFLHLVADAVVSAGVVVPGIVILYTGWGWVDPVVSLVIVAVVVVETWGLFRDSVRMSLDAVPPDTDLSAVDAFLPARPGVRTVHDLHVWSLGTTRVGLTAHLVMPIVANHDGFIDEVTHALHEHFGIEHATRQIETGACERSCETDA